MGTRKVKTTKDANEGLSFEEAMADLEAVVEQLDAGDVPLEQSLSAFEKGVSLVRTLQGRLDTVQKKIESLSFGDATLGDGDDVVVTDFEEE